MPNVPYDSQDLLRRLKSDLGLQDASEYDDDDDLYPLMSTAQEDVIRRIAMIRPSALYQEPTLLTPSTDFKTFTFGEDPNNPDELVMPMGWVQIATNLAHFGPPFRGWQEGDEFTDEGTRIRIRANRTYHGKLWGRWVPMPPSITDEIQPILTPAPARGLIVTRAKILFGHQGNHNPGLVASGETQWARDFPVHMMTYKTRYKNGGALVARARWYPQ